MEQKGRGAQIHDERVDPAVVVVVGEARRRARRSSRRRTARRPTRRRRTSRRPRSRNTECSCGTRWIRPPWTTKMIVAAVVVEIVHAGAPTDILRGQPARSRRFWVTSSNCCLPVFFSRRLYFESVTQRSTRPSPSKSANTGPMAEVVSPFCPYATPAASGDLFERAVAACCGTGSSRSCRWRRRCRDSRRGRNRRRSRPWRGP